MVDHGSVVFGADSHTCTAGALNALGMGFGSADLAAALAIVALWLRAPETIRIDLTGSPPAFVTGKDIALYVTRQLKEDGALGAVLEFGGPGLANLGMDERFAIANMAVEAGADACAFEGDALSTAYLADHRGEMAPPVAPDADALYRLRFTIDLSALSPLVAQPPSPSSVVPVEALVGTLVDQVYIGNCANGSLTDLRQAAAILKGRQVAPGVRLIVVPATQKIMRAAMAEGLLEILAAAGAVIGPSTCGACFGGHLGILAEGETAVATTNRNFRGRMGHPDSRVFLANAWTAAAAAVAGKIVAPATLPSLSAGS
jgi:3-isopropylmalate/(R)-2-methylmalate dehydratase large subunit